MGKASILIVDDEELFCKTITEHLKLLGYEVEYTTSGEKGVELIRSQKPDIVISDLVLPGFTGLDVLEKANAEFPETPIIIISGVAGLEEAVNALRIGAWDYFAKPIDNISEFDKVIKKCLNKAKNIREKLKYKEELEQRIDQNTHELKRSREKFKDLYENAIVGMITANISDGKVIASNEMGYNIFNFQSKDEFFGSNLLYEYCLDSEEIVELLKKKSATGIINKEIRFKRKDDSLMWAEITIKPYYDEDRLEMVIFDITKKKDAERKIFELTFYDSLTNLPNKEMLKNRLLADIMRYDKFAVMCIGIDKFKSINEIYNQTFGDRLLYEIARRLENNFFKKDIVSKLEGDKFFVQIAQVGNEDELRNFEDMDMIVSKTQKLFQEPFHVDNEYIHIDASIGVCFFPNDGSDVDTLLNNSESAMYAAKSQGRSKYAFFDAKMNQKMLQKFQMEKFLKYAIEHNEFLAFYQPMVDGQGRFIGMESLIRWKSSIQNRIVPPLEFIPIAEKNGMIIEIGYSILQEACWQNKKWQDMGYKPIRVSVNLSPYQFSHPDLINQIRLMLEKTGLNPKWLELEITESGIMKNEKESIEKLREIHKMGISISIDDFGTGYSSLSKLKDYPVDILKIDKSFVDDLPNDQTSITLAKTIIDMAHNLGFKVTAEGVETKEQLDFLLEHGCDKFQGYYFSKPLPPQNFEENLKDQ